MGTKAIATGIKRWGVWRSRPQLHLAAPGMQSRSTPWLYVHRSSLRDLVSPWSKERSGGEKHGGSRMIAPRTGSEYAKGTTWEPSSSYERRHSPKDPFDLSKGNGSTEGVGVHVTPDILFRFCF